MGSQGKQTESGIKVWNAEIMGGKGERAVMQVRCDAVWFCARMIYRMVNKYQHVLIHAN